MATSALQIQIDKAKAKIAARRAEVPAPEAPKSKPRAPAAKKAAAPSFLSDIVSDATAGTADASKSVLKRVGDMVAVQRNAADTLARAEEAVKRAKADLFRIESVDMPELLREAGLKEITLEDGTKVVSMEDINCGISQDRLSEAHSWVREHGYGALIKNIVAVAFGKGEEKKAEAAVLAFAKKYGSEAVSQKEAIHPSTLKSFIKERINACAADPEQKKNVPPFDLFGVIPYTIAKISVKKGGAL